MTTFDLPPEVPVSDNVIAIANDGKGECPDCHKRLTVTQSGELRAHRCVNDEPRKRGSNRTKSKKSKDVPGNVMRVGTSAIASGVEFTASRMVASYVPCRPDQVPAEVPDAESMVGPLVKLLWPQLPAKAQSVVSSICDQEDLILCALDWWAWGTKLREFAVQAHEIVAQEEAKKHAQAERPATHTVNLDKRASDVAQKVGRNAVQGQATNGAGGRGLYGIEPFHPASA